MNLGRRIVSVYYLCFLHLRKIVNKNKFTSLTLFTTGAQEILEKDGKKNFIESLII